MQYRRDIDGLRAVAVLPVVLFHAGVPGLPGGFVGVDVFFVISGYLITSLIIEDIRGDRFSLVDFYERRVRRIFPALIAMLAVSSVLAAWLLMPHPFKEFSSSVVSTLLFASNVLFWRRTGYFANPASEEPLLHTWSLAVEEQFYVVFPLVLFVIHRWLGGRWIAWIAPVAVLSFLASVWGVRHDPTATFYLAPTRAWELLLGSLLALKAFPQVRSRALLEGLAALGLGLIAWGVAMLSKTSPFPGVNALFPCVGAALVIYSGAEGRTWVHRLLATGPLVFVGLISYSLYLWHWPLLVFAPLWNVYELTPTATATVVALAFAVATFSWRFVEAPFRRRTGAFRSRRAVFGSAAVAAAALMAFGAYGKLSNGWPERIPAQVNALAAYTESRNPRQGECFEEPGHRIEVADSCSYGAAVPARYALWGDSHADALIQALGNSAEAHGEAVRFYGTSGCAPVLGVEPHYLGGRCIARNAEIFERIVADRELHTVVIVARYVLYLDGHDRRLGPAEADDPTNYLLTDAGRTNYDRAGRAELLRRQLDATVAGMTAAGKRVVVVYPIPEAGYNVPLTLAALALKGGDPASFRLSREFYDERQANVFAMLDGVGDTGPVQRVYPHRVLCDTAACLTYAEGAALYFDDDHLSLAGAELVAPAFVKLFEAPGDARLPQIDVGTPVAPAPPGIVRPL